MNAPMFVSVLNLDRKAIKGLNIIDPYSIHRVVYSLFQDVREDADKVLGKASGIVYADQGGTFNKRQILIVSDRRPAPCIDGQYGRVETKTIGPAFLNFDYYRFKVVVNPCQRDNKTRKLIPVKGREKIARWLIQRSQENWGFSADNTHLQVDKVEVLQFKDKNQRHVTIARAAIQGQLCVTDKIKFQKSFIQGIGRGRAFGCGLLQIVPHPHNPDIK